MKQAIDPNEFKRFSLRTIVIPVVGSLVISGIFIYIIFQLLNVNNLVLDSTKVTRQVNENMQLIVSAETSLRGYLLTGDTKFLEPYYKNLQLIPKKLNELTVMTSDNLGQTNRSKDMILAFQAWQEYAQQVILLKNENKNEKEIEIHLPSNSGKEKMDEIRKIFNRFIEVQETIRDQRIYETQNSIKMTLSLIFGFSLFGGLLIAIFTKKQLNSLSTTYNSVIEKQSIQNLYLEEQEWIQTGKNNLMDQVVGENSIHDLSVNVLNYVCNYLDGKVGTIYNIESGLLQRTAAYALSKEDDNKTLQLGEGIIGQTALGKNIKIINDVPENFLHISSSTMSQKPAQIIILPLVTDKETKAVMEIAFLETIPSKTIRFLNEISESIAIAIKSAEYRHTLNDLLEEAQRHTEVLKIQQEQLQASNEELEEQANALRNSQIKLETQQAEVNLKNQELHNAQERLQYKAKQLELAGQYKSQFLANMSHELRTPLNSTLILSQLLIEDKRKRLGDEEKEFAQTIYSSSHDLLILINDILDLSKIEAGKIDITPTEIIVDDFLESLDRLFHPITDQKKLSLIFIKDSNVPHSIFIDRIRLEQILKNLLSNAIKFTDKGSITLKIGMVEDRISFAITDTGIGIPQEQHSIIFNAFKQADETTSRKYGGTGLGLTISKDLAKLLGGKIFMTSQSGKGSTFTLELPVKMTLNESTHIMTNHFDNTLPHPVPTPSLQPTLPFVDDKETKDEKLKILLVIEDDNNFSKILYEVSHELNYNCIVAQNAQEGIELAKEFRPHAILLDMLLPDRSGLTVINELKNNPKTSFIPIHVISAVDYQEMALQMGAIGYLKKPASLEEVRQAISQIEKKLSVTTKKVLVIEDNKAQRDSIKELIQDDSIEVVTVENAIDALKLLSQHTFECLVLDISLPGMNGYEFLEKMADQKDIQSPPVIVYTGKDLSRLEEQKLQKYSNSIILKGAHSPERLYSEVSLFLHQVESKLPKERQEMLEELRNRDNVFNNKKILLVDDDIRNIFALSSALEGQGALVEIARNGKEALEKVNTDLSIDLILMDIMMPEMDGYTATREIRKDPRFAKLPIIALTAKAMSDDQEKCREAGANDYLAKPIELGKLLSLLRVWMPTRWKNIQND